MRDRTWHWAFALFRAADGATMAVFPLVVALTYDRGVAWVAGVFALMNVAGVPSSILWAKLMENGRYRRRASVFGFLAAGAALFAIATTPPFPVYVMLTILFTVAGIATAPAAGVLALEDVPPDRWGEANGALSRHTGIAYIIGLGGAVVVGLTGFVPVLPWVFVAAGTSAVAAAVVASRTIPQFEPGHMEPTKYRREAVQKGQRRFERYMWFPSRLRNMPRSWSEVRKVMTTPSRSLLLGMFLLFAGTLVVLASYPGVLGDRLGLAPGLVLLAQAPSFLASSMTYAPAGRLGDRLGLVKALRIGVYLRLLVVPTLMLTILFFGTDAFLLILLLHALLGVAFAFLTVNGPCLAAELATERRGEAIGWFHASSGLGVMAGALTAAVAIALFSLEVSYVIASLFILVGTVLMLTRFPAKQSRAAAEA